jgi:hypothetical protein
MSGHSRLTQEQYEDIKEFIKSTEKAWRAAGLIKDNSFGVELLVAERPSSDFSNVDSFEFGRTRGGAEHDQAWYVENGHGKNLICLATGIDSHEAVRLWQGKVALIEGAYPWGGAVIDTEYGLIIGVSGFEEDEDILFARTIRNRLVMMMDRDGQHVLDDARQRGDQPGEAGADRFTRVV